MKKLWDSPVPFLAYGLPYVYLGLWGDAEKGKFLANFLYIIGFFTLMKWAYHRNSLKVLFLGNALSFLASCPCLSVFGAEKWGQPLLEPAAAFKMLWATALIALAVQLVWWRVKRRTQKRS